MIAVGINKITDTIYLGDADGSNNVEKLQELKVTHVLSMNGRFAPELTSYFKQKKVEVGDFPWTNIMKYFKECIEFIDQADIIFVHCMQGISRSSTIVIAYLIWKKGMSYDEAYNFVKKGRNIIEPNDGFVKQLKKFEKELKNNNYELDKIEYPQKKIIENL